MRKKNWAGELPVTVFVLSDDNPLHMDFSKSILKLYPYQLRKTWNRQIYSGTGQAPIEVTSSTEMLDRVSSTVGSIGYLESQLIDTSRVKSIEVR